MQGGDGYPLEYDKWVKVGRLTFDIRDIHQNFELVWHEHETFPPCFVGEKFEGKLYEAEEGNYENLMVELSKPVVV